MKRDIDSLLVSPRRRLGDNDGDRERLRVLVGLSGIAVAVDGERRLIGVVTDGDIRSAILRGLSLDQPISSIMTQDPIAVTNHASPMKMYESVTEMLKGGTRMLDRGAGKVVVVDDDGRVVDVISFLSLWQQADIKTRRIAVLGLGFVGLTLAVVLADADLTWWVSKLKSVIESLRKGIPHF
jgi:UDP-N-acetyl-D-mannosaminuronic acid dehydrogenase